MPARPMGVRPVGVRPSVGHLAVVPVRAVRAARARRAGRDVGVGTAKAGEWMRRCLGDS
ncbi:hypothetical protein [Frigoribacterium sp. CFBP 8751]|uniref:hypothetical protein n=1 Tax=Frigoribacterium sp. CFBP 8751 TaxID=2775277 RepID=UPI0012E074AD|nr:hypothetical protein [Frigoribacterium sp. CFBP 8751]MBD8537855.1 hypothetical protein [Frigoribacterium sp. CFBP 8751]